MITLGPSQSFAASCSEDMTLTCAIFADQRTPPPSPQSTPPTPAANIYAMPDNFPLLLPAAQTVLVSAPATGDVLIKTIGIHNPSSISISFAVFVANNAQNNEFQIFQATIPAGGSCWYDDDGGWTVYDASGVPLTNAGGGSTITLQGDVTGSGPSTGIPTEYVGPSWSGPVNTIGNVTTTTPNTVADSRSIPAGELLANYNLYAHVWGNISGASSAPTAGIVNLVLGIAEDLSNALVVAVPLGCPVSPFEAEFVLNVNAPAGPNMSKSRLDLNNSFGFQIERGTFTLDLATTACTPTLEAWVAVSGDIITIDGVTWELRRA